MIRYGIRKKVKVKRQERVEKVQCFRCRGIKYYKWECPNIEVEKEKRRQKEVVYSIREKAQQQKKVKRIKPVYPNQGKVQKYCRVENVPEDAQLLELGWMTEEVIATYIECRWYRKKEIYQEDNKRQGVLRGKRLEKAK